MAHLKPKIKSRPIFSWLARYSRDSQRFGVSIITSTADAERVIVCPSNALLHCADVSEEGNEVIELHLGSETHPGQDLPPTFPFFLQPYEIAVSDLHEALLRLLECARNGAKEW